MAHPLPPEVVLVQCFCFEGGKWFVQASEFTRYCEQIPLLGMLALGHQKFAPKELDVDAHGMLTVDGVIEMQTGASVKAANQLADNVNLHVLNVLSSEGYGYTFVAEDAGNQQARAESVSFLPHCCAATLLF
jgi:hypothetical protein